MSSVTNINLSSILPFKIRPTKKWRSVLWDKFKCQWKLVNDRANGVLISINEFFIWYWPLISANLRRLWLNDYGPFTFSLWFKPNGRFGKFLSSQGSFLSSLAVTLNDDGHFECIIFTKRVILIMNFLN